MGKVIGGVLGAAAFAAVMILALAKGIPFQGWVWRAVVAAALGWLVGWMLFGKLGVALVKEAAGQEVANQDKGTGKEESAEKNSSSP